MPAFRRVAAILVALVLAAPAHAETIVHGTAVPAGEAVPTSGSFSIRFPIDYKDAEFRVEDPKAPTLVVHMLSGLSREGLRFSATETPIQGQPLPLDSFMEVAKKRPGATVSDVRHENKDGTETLSFSLTEPKDGSYFRLIRTKITGYVLVIQFPNTLYSTATSMKDDFFGSFKITRP